MSALPRPQAGEHAEYYARYVAGVPDGDILYTLKDQLGETLAILQGLSPEQERFRYAPEKWSLREVVGHLIDSERVFAYRALTMARSEGADLPGMDQNEWVEQSNADDRPLDDLCAEWAALRRANVHLFATLSEEEGARSGRASGYDFTVRSFPWIIAGHELWHRQHISENYLGGGDGNGS